MNDPILRPRVAAERLGVKKDCLYKWIRKGLMVAPIKLGPRVSGWRESYINELIAKRENEGVPVIEEADTADIETWNAALEAAAQALQREAEGSGYEAMETYCFAAAIVLTLKRQ